MIKVDNLCKDFKVQLRRSGMRGYVKDLFFRQYEIKNAVKDISFEIKSGEIVGYIGPNGAGKSTTIKMLTGILVPTKGQVRVGEIEPYRNRKENAKQIGVVFGQRTQLWWDIPVEESLSLIRYMYRIPVDIYEKNIKDFKDILGLENFMKIAVRQLSLGQRMRAELACAMLHNPKVLFLDEPSIGLDVVVKEKIREFIKEINRIRQTTVILTTHDMLDVEKLCSRVMVIDEGHIMYDGTLQELVNKYGSVQTIRIEFASDNIDFAALNKMQLPNINLDGKALRVSYDTRKTNSLQVLDAIRNENPIIDFKVSESNTEEIIREMYKALPSIKQ